MLEQSIDLLGQLDELALQQLLRGALQGTPLRTPTDHTGHAATQMFRLCVPSAQRQEILRAIRAASERGMTTQDTAHRGLGGFVEAWREYACYEG